ncbi:MAG: sigma-70 family RNA polymerase sigma factor [Verrucomicrobiales bacterium]|nr:sigma-70 family RNA polymerase sigma factor [Verrucomicrobiales bacterium]
MGEETRNLLPQEPGDNRTDPPAVEATRWVEEHGDILFRHALARVRNAAQAEDLVQETFLAALKARDRFAGRSSERTWLVGILKHKLIDHLRKSARETSFTDLECLAETEASSFMQEGLSRGKWQAETQPQDWHADPSASLDREAFWLVFRECLGGLPARVADAFLLREMDGLETGDICTSLGISPGNFWVMLHRARLALRRCLEINWFAKE